MAMDVSDRDCEAVRATLFREPLPLARLGHRPVQGLAGLVLMTLDPAELGLHTDTARLHRVSHGTGEGQVLTEGELRTVGHHGVYSAVGAPRNQAPAPGGVDRPNAPARQVSAPTPKASPEPLSPLRREGRRTH